MLPKGGMRAISEDDGVPAFPQRNRSTEIEELLLNPASSAINAPMSRSRMNEVYGLFKSTKLVSGPRQTKAVHQNRFLEKPLVPVSSVTPNMQLTCRRKVSSARMRSLCRSPQVSQG